MDVITHQDRGFDLSDLPLDVFDISDAGLTVESLTAGHGMDDMGASTSTCICGCSCCPCS